MWQKLHVVLKEEWSELENSNLGPLFRFMKLDFKWASVVARCMLTMQVVCEKETKLRKFGRARRSSRRPKVTILIWKDRYLSHASRRSGMKPFGSTMRPRLIFYRDMSGKRVNEAHGGFGVSNGPSSSAKGLDRIEKRPG
ncbi:unnamed protein product [Microthlaspi erraticum]|uniref:Uncharacterized protein n=1 Tax=Microthlaspi erraticum TaxID=1685480 RepID=A0A6D2JE45_9BRAS|nr:unnamed protein product [Microthlaspi erraticum]